WSPPPDSPAPDTYEIHRDGGVIQTVDSTTTSYVDRTLSPATSYDYQVVTVWGGSPSDPREPLPGKTLAPPLSSARLAGAALPVKVKIVANDTITNLRTGLAWTDSWDITPRCASGPCAVDVSGTLAPPGFHIKTFRMTLGRHGAVYSGTTRAQITYCSTTAVTDTLTLRITVKRAGPEGTEWLANSWTGTLSVQVPYTDVG